MYELGERQPATGGWMISTTTRRPDSGLSDALQWA
jgi:hypothetical protein